MRCEEVRNLIHAYVDRELDWKTRAQLFAHFRRCSVCRGELREAEELTRAMQSFRTPIPPDVAQRMEAQLKAAVGEREYARAVHASSRSANGGLLTFPRRKLLTGTAAVAAAAGVAILARRGHTDELDDTILAMSRVKTAHASGTYISYHFPGHTGAEMAAPVDYWYASPGKYRRSAGRANVDVAQIPVSLYATGNVGVHVVELPTGLERRPARPETFPLELRAFDIFSGDALLRRLRHMPGTQVRIEPGGSNGNHLTHILVKSSNIDWELWADPETHLLKRSRFTARELVDGKWKLDTEEQLSEYEYGIEIPPSKFVPPI